MRSQRRGSRPSALDCLFAFGSSRWPPMQILSRRNPTPSAAGGELVPVPARGTSPRLTFAGPPFHQARESVVSPLPFRAIGQEGGLCHADAPPFARACRSIDVDLSVRH